MLAVVLYIVTYIYNRQKIHNYNITAQQNNIFMGCLKIKSLKKVLLLDLAAKYSVGRTEIDLKCTTNCVCLVYL